MSEDQGAFVLTVINEGKDLRQLIKLTDKVQTFRRLTWGCLAVCGILFMATVLTKDKIPTNLTATGLCGTLFFFLILLSSLAFTWVFHVRAEAIETARSTVYNIYRHETPLLFSYLADSLQAAARRGHETEALRLFHEIAERYSMGVKAPVEVARLHELGRVT